MAVLTVQATGRQWDDFRRLLITAIADEPDRAYWESWVEALDHLVKESGIAG